MKLEQSEWGALAYLEIFPKYIYDAICTAEKLVRHVADEYGLDAYSLVNELNTEAVNEMKEVGTFENITASVINAYFSTAKWICEREANGIEVDYEVNGMCSALYVNGEQFRR